MPPHSLSSRSPVKHLSFPLQRTRQPSRTIPFQGVARCQIPRVWRTWLCDTGSLTQRLVKISQGAFRVILLRQQHAPARISELRRLDLPPRGLPLIREVLLTCHGEPWVYARSVIPRTTEQGAGRHLTRLGTRPLGAALFSDPTVQRGTIWLRHETLPQPTELPDDWPWPTDPQWGRQSVFRLGEDRILVSEYFLMPCARYSEAHILPGATP